MRSLRDLDVYLSETYTVAELKQLSPEWDSVGREFRETLSLGEYCEQFVAGLDRRGLIDEAFFERLSATRPRRERRVRRLRRAFTTERWLLSASLAAAELNPAEELAQLLLQAFERRELVRFARQAPGAPFVRHVVQSELPVDELAERLVAIWQIESVLDEEWFAHLRRVRPHRRVDIEPIEGLVLHPVPPERAQEARQQLAIDVGVLVSHLRHPETTSTRTLPEVLACPLDEGRTQALVSWLCRRDALAWEVATRDDELEPRLRMLRGFRAAFLADDAAPGRLRQAVEPLLPRPHTRIFLSYAKQSALAATTTSFR
ncbi:MAG: hypothetical protein AAF602_18330, partial [Myxococcota bacterium]